MKWHRKLSKNMFLALLLLLNNPDVYAQSTSKSVSAIEQTAVKRYEDLQYNAITMEPIPYEVKDGKVVDKQGKLITFGAEKEGIDVAIANLMSPPAKNLKSFFVSPIGTIKSGRNSMLRDFLTGIISGEYRKDEIYDEDQKLVKKISPQFTTKDGSVVTADQVVNLSDKEVIKLFNQWLEKTEDRPFSFLKKGVGRWLVEGKFPLKKDNFELFVKSLNVVTEGEEVDSPSKKSKKEKLSKTIIEMIKNKKFLNGTKAAEKTDIYLSDKQFDSLDHNQRIAIIRQWLERAGERPFDFISSDAKNLIMNTDFKGQNYGIGRNEIGYKYLDWKPQFGTPEKYIVESEPAANYVHRHAGWEIKFSILKSYGEKEKFLKWFRENARNTDQDEYYSAPGHQRIVWAQPDLPAAEQEKIFKRVGELFKNYQAYIILTGIISKNGVIGAKWKDIISDEDIASLKTWKGVIRLEKNRWPKSVKNRDERGTLGVEIRSGTKEGAIRRFLDQVLIARATTNDWSGIADVDSWKLIPKELIAQELNRSLNIVPKLQSVKEFAQKYDLDRSQVAKFFTIVKTKFMPVEAGFKFSRPLHVSHLAPLWNWDDAPYVSAEKRKILKNFAKDFIAFIVKKGDGVTFEDIEIAVQKWANVTRIDRDIEYYLKPHLNLSVDSTPHHYVGKHNGTINPYDKNPAAPVDVNAIDLGIEYTARLPIKDASEFEEKEGTGKVWVDASLALTEKERKDVIYHVAKSLGKQIGSKEDLDHLKSDQQKEEEEKAKRGELNKEKGHGHGLGHSYTIKDAQGREWRVEWDGIGRDYDQFGQVIPGSTRGGVIELVTPKFVPQTEDITRVFAAFKENSVVPSIEAGGGHVNIDLTPFKGRPEAFARFLSIFHLHRGVMSLLYQNPKRVKTAAPVPLSEELHQALLNFKGSETELKQLLYNHHYFNDRIGRKSRYLQLDISSYFQDVIPAEYISKDFDIINPTVLWRQEFRVAPKARKMEFRMMDAPRDALESSRQMKLVRAMLAYALNSKRPLKGAAQKIDFEQYAQNPTSAFRDLKTMTEQLDLDFEDYKGTLAEKISLHQDYMKSKFFSTVEQKLASHPRLEFSKWKKALSVPRAENEGPNAKEIDFEKLPAEIQAELTLPEAVAIRDKKIIKAKKADQERINAFMKTKDQTKEVCLKRNIDWEDNFGAEYEHIVELAKKIAQLEYNAKK